MAKGMFMKLAAVASALTVSAGGLALAAAVHWLPSDASGSSATDVLGTVNPS